MGPYFIKSWVPNGSLFLSSEVPKSFNISGFDIQCENITKELSNMPLKGMILIELSQILMGVKDLFVLEIYTLKSLRDGQLKIFWENTYSGKNALTQGHS